MYTIVYSDLINVMFIIMVARISLYKSEWNIYPAQLLVQKVLVFLELAETTEIFYMNWKKNWRYYRIENVKCDSSCYKIIYINCSIINYGK